jgi:hypothetical protein
VPPGIVNWNDQDNNNSFHSKEIILCLNGSLSIELAQIDKKEQYEDQFTRGLPLANHGKPRVRNPFSVYLGKHQDR